MPVQTCSALTGEGLPEDMGGGREVPARIIRDSGELLDSAWSAAPQVVVERDGRGPSGGPSLRPGVKAELREIETGGRGRDRCFP